MDIEEVKLNDYTVLRNVASKPKVVDTPTNSEVSMEHMEHETKGESYMHSGFTNPALPVTVSGGDFGRHGGFEPADAALVQSNNLATIQALICTNTQMLNESISRNSKENALISKDNQITMLTMQNSNMMQMQQLQSAIDKLSMKIDCCLPVPAPTRG